MQTGHLGNNGECTIQTHREPIYWQMLCEVSISLPTHWVMEALSGHLDCLSAASAALVVILCLVCINSKNIFQLNLLNPRWCSTLLVTLSLSQIASHSILLSAMKCPPWAVQLCTSVCLTVDTDVIRDGCSLVPYRKQPFNCHFFGVCVQFKYLMLWVSL